MSCNHCSTKFNFFHKEMGCANCSLSFCSKCLKQKHKIPSKGDEEYNICKKCFLQLTSGASDKSNRPPPDMFLRRLENLENPAAHPITVYKTDPKIESLRRGLSTADQKLLERLEKLKDDGKGPPPTEVEIRERLQKLKGENEYVEGPSKPLYTVDTRTDQEKADSLLEQFSEERDIELSHQNLDDIETRVAALREQGVRPNEGTYIKNLHDSDGSEEEADTITKKIMDEVALDERLPSAVSTKIKSTSKTTNDDDDDELNDDSPELPWCVLCNNDAKYRCTDCGGDLYCSSCNKEVHKTWGDTDHHVIPYKP